MYRKTVFINFYSLQQIRLNATRQLEILISGEDVTDQLVNLNASISTDLYSVSRSSSNSILATFPNGMGLMVNRSSMLTFTVIIPDAFRGLTRGTNIHSLLYVNRVHSESSVLYTVVGMVEMFVMVRLQ